MAVTVAATQVDDASEWKDFPPELKGDPDWIPDVYYNRRFLLECSGPEVGSVVNWEIYDAGTIPVVDNAATWNKGGAATEGTVVPLVYNRLTRTVWARNATAWGDGTAAPYYDETGAPWMAPLLRANGPRAVIELPAYLKWGDSDDPGSIETVTFEIEAFLPGAGKVPSGFVSVDVTSPDVQVLG